MFAFLETDEPMETDEAEKSSATEEEIVHDDGVFTLKIGPSSAHNMGRPFFCS